MERPRVGIVGAGISGLLACKYAASIGLTPVVFEEQPHAGGLWNHTIKSTRLQNSKDFFQFSDFRWPDSDDGVFPGGAEVLQYVQSYADHFELLPYINFKCRVMSMEYVGVSEEEMEMWDLWGGFGEAFGSKGKWNLKVLHIKDQSVKEYVVEFVVLCIGRFSGLPSIPEFPPGKGPDVFSGQVLHSMDYSAMDNAAAAEFIKGKRIAVIGSGKSAVDIAAECANANGSEKPCSLICRTAHWMLPDAKALGLLSFSRLCFTRIFELMVHKPGEGFLNSTLATLLSPLRWAISKYVERYISWKTPLKKYGMIPGESFVQEISSCQILYLPENFFDKVKDGSIIFKRSQHFSFCDEGLMIEGEHNPIKADLVIFATGYKGDEKLRNMFVSPTFRKRILGSQESTVPLYRQMIHPRIPQLAIIGYSESLSNLYSSEMRCKWLSFFMDQAFHLPSIKEMEEDIEKWDTYMKKYAGNGKFRRGCIAGIHIWYNDQICKDIGCDPKRKKGLLSNLFEPHGLRDYAGIHPRQL
ncbi:probable flavin-containing monooxygenase 1 [Andrographis paniculata]|uniref:probable flavin-containing monooxygenase 1 n=1 Tax=Andrographis paniculata TaxID=175694 RepID=UPI0021E71F40|nr:probable flavin-containing monooxygenase 1 [Andrographis paniculata]